MSDIARPHPSSSPKTLTRPLLLLAFILLPTYGRTQAHPTTDTQQALLRSPRDWARDVAASETADILRHDVYFRYRVHVVDHRGDRTRDVIEAREGTVSRTILRDGRPLTDAEDQAERERLTGMLDSPSAFARHVKNDAEGRKLAVDLVKYMPDAMVYTYTPGQPQVNTGTAHPNGAAADLRRPAVQALPVSTAAAPSPQIVMDYKPDPAWKPPTTSAEALVGFEGRMWIDPASHQLVRMEGSIFQGVNIGWGMLAHLYPGGKLLLEQADAGGHRWIYTRFTEEATVRALMVKTMNVHTTVEAGSFRPLPSAISYQEAIHLLLDAPLPGK